MPTVVFAFAFTVLEAEIKDAVGFERVPEALQSFRELVFRQVKQAGAGPDAVVGGDFVNVGKAAPGNRQAGMRLRQGHKFRGGVECRDAVALLMKGLAVPPRAATRIENKRASRQLGEKTLMERCHVDALCIREKSFGMGIVIGDGVALWHRLLA